MSSTPNELFGIYTPMIYWYDDKAAITAVDIQPIPFPPTRKRDAERSCERYYKLATVSVKSDVRLWEYCFEKTDNPKGVDPLYVEFIANLQGHTKTVNCCKFAPNGELLATGDVDGSLLIWMYVDEPVTMENAENMDIPPNKENWKVNKKVRVRHESDINCLCWSPDSKYIATGSADNSIAVHDALNGRRIWDLRNFRNVPVGLCWDPKSKYVVCCSSDRRLDIVDAQRGHRRREIFSVTGLKADLGSVQTQLEVPYKLFHDSQLIAFTRSVEFSPCGKLLFVPAAHLEVGEVNQYGTYVIRRSDFETCRPFVLLPSKKPTIAAKCSPIVYELLDDTEENFLGLPYRVIFATLTKDSITLYDSQKRDPIMYVSNIHYDVLSSFCWSPDGKNIAISSFEGFCTFIKDFEPKLGHLQMSSKMCGFYGLFMCLMLVFCVSMSTSSKFDELFQPSWAFDHFVHEGDLLKLKLDNSSGAGFGSKNKYMFGKVSIQLKLVEGDSAGTVTAFYMSSEGTKHNEFDFEFLGNSTGEPYSVQTNVYVNGVGNREQRLNLWFDPTKDFHSYSIFWNQRQVVFLVDETPIRVHTNMEHRGIPYPKDQAMGVYSSIWNADDWATQGGRVKTDWSHAPFIATYKAFEINACECPVSVDGMENRKRCSSSEDNKYWWDEPNLSVLNLHQTHQLKWVRAKHMVYDYCNDVSRFPVSPLECLHHRHN